MPEQTNATVSTTGSTSHTLDIDTAKLTLYLNQLKTVLAHADKAARASVRPLPARELESLRGLLQAAAVSTELSYIEVLSFEPTGKAETISEDAASEVAAAASETEGDLSIIRAAHPDALHALCTALQKASTQCGLALNKVRAEDGTIDSGHASFQDTVSIFPGLEDQRKKVKTAFGGYTTTLAAVEKSEGKGKA